MRPALDSRSKRALQQGRRSLIGALVSRVDTRHGKLVRAVSLSLAAVAEPHANWSDDSMGHCRAIVP